MGVKSAKKARKGILNTLSVLDDVEVRELLAKQTKQAKDCKIGGSQRTSPATAVTCEAPGVEASGSADISQAQKSSPAGENFQHFVHYKVSSKEVQCDSKRSRPPRKSWQSSKSK